ncbi:YcaO-like family protein [Halomicrobium salinisoli]|uniref:YcaO-like family protein n=1 Tax=Halomicrobium salinisoli TaxID=2878391 RepID=UPI001CF09043|nr:YcaO-like family protein [Halomicrobium salinisoli]
MDPSVDRDGDIADPAVRGLVGEKTGIVEAVENNHLPRGTFPVVFLSTRYGGERAYTGVGNKRDRRDSLMAAVGETAERHCLAHASPAEPSEPLSFPGAADRYERTVGFAYFDIYDRSALARSPYDAPEESEPIRWVRGRELLDDEPVRLPVDMVYEPDRSDDGLRYFRSSNGMACGSTLRQAVRNAVYELVERHVVLRAWFTRTAPEQIDLSNLPAVAAAKREFETDAYDVQLVSFPNDLGVPTVGAVLTRTDGGTPAFVFGLAASLDVEEACHDALREVPQLWFSLRRKIADGDHRREFDPDGLFSLMGGALYHSLPERGGDASLFTDDLETVRPDPTGTADPETPAVSRLLDRFRDGDFRVVAVDVTTPDVRQVGFHVVRAVVPELVPLAPPSLYPSRHPAFDGERVVKRPHPLG